MGFPSHSNEYSESNPDPATPAARGRRTAIATLYRRAEVEPNKLFGSFPLTDDIGDGFRDFTFAEMANAIDACAWHVKETFGTSEEFEAILYMGVNDFRYTIFMYAAIKCGFQALFINPRYPIEGVMAVIENMKCLKGFYSPEERPVIENIQSRRPGFTALELASLTHWLDAKPRPFPFSKTWEESKNDPVLSVHSSGTTGLPKPITFRNGYYAICDVVWPIPPGKRSLHPVTSVDECQLTFSIFPQAHAGGVIMNNIRTVYSSCASVMLPAKADYTRSAQLALEIMRLKPVDTLSATPLLLENICTLPGGVEALTNLHSILSAGGPLRHNVAETIAAKNIFTINCYGATELGFIPGLEVDAVDYEYFHFNPYYKLVFDPTNDEVGSYELIIRKGAGPGEDELHDRRGIRWTYGVDEHRSKDLFLPHPTKPDLWKYYGRTDDILVLAHAGKINPIPLEDIISSHPGISGAFVTGEYRFPPSILIEPASKVADHKLFIEEVWPTIEKANAKLRKEMRIPKDMVAVLEEQGLARGIKGQVVRKTNVQKHGDVIDRLYAEREKGAK